MKRRTGRGSQGPDRRTIRVPRHVWENPKDCKLMTLPSSAFRIAVLPGDGIGQEVMPPCLEVIEAAARRVGGFGLRFEELSAGAEVYRDSGDALPAATREACRRADAI